MNDQISMGGVSPTATPPERDEQNVIPLFDQTPFQPTKTHAEALEGFGNLLAKLANSMEPSHRIGLLYASGLALYLAERAWEESS